MYIRFFVSDEFALLKFKVVKVSKSRKKNEEFDWKLSENV